MVRNQLLRVYSAEVQQDREWAEVWKEYDRRHNMSRTPAKTRSSRLGFAFGMVLGLGLSIPTIAFTAEVFSDSEQSIGLLRGRTRSMPAAHVQQPAKLPGC